MLTRYVTSFIVNLLETGPRNFCNIESRLFHTTGILREKKSGFWGKKEDTGPKIIRPDDCSGSPKPICDPKCKVAIVVGGSDGFGFAAADHLLCKGARNIVIVDNNFDQGHMAVQKLCDSHGKHRVLFLEGDIKNIIHFESALKQAVCRHKRVDIIFNDLDRDWCFTNKICDKPQEPKNTTALAIQAGLKILGKNQGGFGGIIVNCASIFGFLGWPADPFPIYCKKEPAIEITLDFAKEYKISETGVRLVTLCPANKPFSDIGLPEFPEPIPNKRADEMPCCVPTSKQQIGPALSHVLAWADNGTAWLVEPAFCARDVPRLIHFPAAEGEKVDPKVYETQVLNLRIKTRYIAKACSVNTKTSCLDTSKACSLTDSKVCKYKIIKTEGTSIF